MSILTTNAPPRVGWFRGVWTVLVAIFLLWKRGHLFVREPGQPVLFPGGLMVTVHRGRDVFLRAYDATTCTKVTCVSDHRGAFAASGQRVDDVFTKG